MGINNSIDSSNFINKILEIYELSIIYNINLNKTMYMGDDLPDVFPMKLVYLKACPFDSSPEVREISDYISDKNGGKGCVRDIIEQTLRVQGKWKLNEKNQNI